MEIVIAIASSTLVTSLVTWFLNKRFNKAQVKKTDAETQQTWSRIYSQLLADQQKQVEEYKKRYEEAEADFREKVEKLNDYIEQLEKLNKEFKSELKKLKSENDELRKR
jgi:flagellar hook-associated protein FlgK